MKQAFLAISMMIAAFSTQAFAAEENTHVPHRPWGKVAVLDTPFADAQACIAREVAKMGKVLVLPVSGGADIDWTMKSFSLGKGGDPYATFKLREADGAVTLTALYRRPFSQKTIDGAIRGFGENCLTIKSETAEAAS